MHSSFHCLGPGLVAYRSPDSDSFVLFFVFNCGKEKYIKFSILTILSVRFSDIEYFHNVVLTSTAIHFQNFYHASQNSILNRGVIPHFPHNPGQSAFCVYVLTYLGALDINGVTQCVAFCV